MGTNDLEVPLNEQPARQVNLDAFYIDKNEVTREQYEGFMLSGGYKKRHFWAEEGWQFITENEIDAPLGFRSSYLNPTPHQPVVGVSWYEADAYARWVSKRLPTEAEWEKAARGKDGNSYPWGQQMDFTRVFYLFGRNPAPVGSYPQGASPFGVFDMAGNAWEWCADWYDEFLYIGRSNSSYGKDGKAKKTMRGGCWMSGALEMRSTYRDANRPEYRNTTVGFRCVRDAN